MVERAVAAAELPGAPPVTARNTYAFAASTASATPSPRARPAAVAEAKLHPVPWLFGVSIRGARSSRVAVPSKTTSTASSPVSSTAWPPLTTTTDGPSAPSARAASCCSARVRIGVSSSTWASRRLGVSTVAYGSRAST